jgi:hypothetical protein
MLDALLAAHAGADPPRPPGYWTMAACRRPLDLWPTPAGLFRKP